MARATAATREILGPLPNSVNASRVGSFGQRSSCYNFESMRKAVSCFAVVVIVLPVILWCFGHPDIPRSSLEMRYAKPPSQFLVLPGNIRAHIRDWGPRDGQPLVLIHGSTDSLITWEPWISRLRDTFRIITPDLPGHGLTGAVADSDYSEEGMVRFISEVANALKLDTFVVGGNSMGGRIAARFTEEHPARVTQLILIDSGGFGKRGAPAVEFAFSLLSKPVLARPLLNIAPRWLVAVGLDQAVSSKAVLSKERINAFWDLNHLEGTRDATILRLSTATSSVREHLREIQVPTLILWGEEDRVVPVEAAHGFQAAIRNSKLIIYPHTGHLPQEEVADESAAEVRAFLTAHK